MTPPLEGLVVVALEQAISAPFATRQLADLGATVVKIERPDGDLARHYDTVVNGESAFFVWANKGKQSVALDVKADRDLLSALIGGADVFIHNLSPRAAADVGVEAATLHARFPALIAAEISGYGRGGPRGEDKAYDLAIQAEAGVFSVTGAAEMSKVGFSVADISAGMYALSSILAALVRRERTGEGAAIHVAMLDSLVEWMSAPLYNAVYSGGQPERSGRRHHSIAPYGTFDLEDGSTILIAVQSDAEWRSMAEAFLGDAGLGVDPRFCSNAQRIANVNELEELIRQRIATLPADEVRERLAHGRIAHARVNDLAGVWNHEQLRARQRFADVSTPSGSVEVLRPPFDISGWSEVKASVPALNEHEPSLLALLRARAAERRDTQVGHER